MSVYLLTSHPEWPGCSLSSLPITAQSTYRMGSRIANVTPPLHHHRQPDGAESEQENPPRKSEDDDYVRPE